MSKNKKIIITLISLITITVVSIFTCLFFPITKPVVENANSWVDKAAPVNEKSEYVLKTKDKEISGFLFYAPWNIDGIEIEMSIYNDKELIYHNYFNNVNKSSNKIVLKKNIKNIDSITVKYEIKRGSDILHLIYTDDGNLRIDPVTRIPTYYPILWEIIVFIGLVAALCIKIRNDKNKDDKQISPKKLFLIYFITSLASSILAIYVSNNLAFQKTKKCFPIILLLISIVLTAILFSKLYKKYHKKLETLFLILAIPVSLMYCIFSMPGDAPDEWKHFARAYSYINGEFRTEDSKTTMPNDLNTYWLGFGTTKSLFENMQNPTNYKETKQEANMAYIYNPSVYIPTMGGLIVGKTFNINITVTWYLCKIINTIIFLVSGYYIIKIMPKFKKFTLFTLLMPFVLYEVTSTSADVLIIISSFLFIAYFLKMYEEKRKFTFKDSIIATILGIVFLVAKPVYFPIFVGLLLLNIDFKNDKKRIIYCVVPSIIIVLIYLIWNKLLTVEVANNYTNIIAGNMGLKYILTHPIDGFRTMFENIINCGDLYTTKYIGEEYIWNTVTLPTHLPFIYMIVLMLSILFREDKDNTDKYSKIVLSISGIFAFLLVFLAMYVIEYRSNVLTNSIWGVQGRYFFPVIILFLMSINKIDVKQEVIDKITKAMIILFFVLHALYIVKLIELVIA